MSIRVELSAKGKIDRESDKGDSGLERVCGGESVIMRSICYHRFVAVDGAYSERKWRCLFSIFVD